MKMPVVTIIIWHYIGNSRYKTYNHKNWIKWFTMIWRDYDYMLKNKNKNKTNPKKEKPMVN